jgi:hypothetical protein
MKNLTKITLAAVLLPVVAQAQDTTLAGWTFSQFLGEGAPQINAETFESTGSIVATYRGNTNPLSSDVDGTVVINSSGTGYTNSSIGTWSFGAFDINNADDVRADTFGALNTINSTTLDGKQMHLTDSAGMMLTFRKTTTLWNIQVANTAGYTNASVSDFTFAARGNDGAATVEWFFNDQLFSTTTVTAGSFNVYSAELPSQFYGNGSIQGRLVSGKVSFDNVQINGTLAAIPEPSSFAALAGLVGLGFAASRRRRGSC